MINKLSQNSQIMMVFTYMNDGAVEEVSWERDNTVETVCLLSKLKSNHHIEVEIKLDKMDLISAEKKATYKEI